LRLREFGVGAGVYAAVCVQIYLQVYVQVCGADSVPREIERGKLLWVGKGRAVIGLLG